MIDQVFREIFREELRSAIADLIPKAVAPPLHANEYLSAKEAGELVGVSAETIGEWVRQGHLPRYDAGRYLRVKRTDLEAFLARKTTGDNATDLDQKVDSILSRRKAGV